MTYSENALNTYKKLYFKGDKIIPEKTHKKIAKFASLNNKTLEKDIFNCLNNQKIRFNTPTMMNAGYVNNPQTSACFVGKLEDNINSIFDFDRDCGLIYKEGSGIGINYGNLRETFAPLSKGGNSSGPFSFIHKSASTCWAVKSGGSSRRAAFMNMMYDWHPDILNFIKFKEQNKNVKIKTIDGNEYEYYSCMNFSIAMSNLFMQKVINNENWDLIGVVDKQVKQSIKAKNMFNLIAEYAWKCGDPGVWFIDQANKFNTLKTKGSYISTNACGEQNLHPYESCALGSINLSKCIYNDCIDYELLKMLIYLLVESIDNMIDISGYPTENFRNAASESRNIGIGFTGMADMLIKLGIPYNSQESYELMKTISTFITKHSIYKSSILAREKGTFALYDDNKESVLEVARHFFNFTNQSDEILWEHIENYGVRNSNWTTVPPCGTTSISCDCSSGMEPLPAICYQKQISDESNEIWTFINPTFEQICKHEKWYNKAISQIIENKGSCQGITCIPTTIQKIFKCAHDIHWKERIEMQSYIQQGISNAISSTINLTNNATIGDIKNIYLLGFEKNLKGITVYRDGCKEWQPINFGKKVCPPVEEKKQLQQTEPRGIKTTGETYSVKTPHGKLYVTLNWKDGKPCEVFLRMGTVGSLENYLLDRIAIFISKMIRNNYDIKSIAKELRDGKEQKFYFKLDENQEQPFTAEGILDAVGILMDQIFINGSNNNKVEVKKEFNPETLKEKCPECGGFTLTRDSGCKNGFCTNCFYSSCS